MVFCFTIFTNGDLLMVIYIGFTTVTPIFWQSQVLIIEK